MKVSQIVAALETIAPPSLACDWDNVGLLVGDAAANARRLLLCIDLTPAVLAEARRVGAGMVMAYHPVIFKPVGRFTPDSAKIAYQAARAGLAVYSMHTALDAAVGGLNDVLADILGIGIASRRPIEPSSRVGQRKIVCFVPPGDLSRVAEAAFAAGAGRVGNYFDCAFFSHGVGSFCGNEKSRPARGSALRHEAAEELRLEVIAPRAAAGKVVAAMRAAHSYETPAIDVYPLEDYPPGCGLGRIGPLAKPADVIDLVNRVKRATGMRRIWLARAVGASGRLPAKAARLPTVKVAAAAAGACGDLFRAACDGGATFLLTGEIRHHEALEASRRGLSVACLGHSNSERVGLTRLAAKVRSLLRGLAVTVSRSDRDPLEIV